MKTFAKYWLLALFAIIVLTIFFIVPVGFIIIAIVKLNLYLALLGLIWLVTNVALCVVEEDDIKEMIKEEFKL